MMSGVIGYFISISLVVGLIFVLYYVAQFLINGSPLKRGENRRLKVLEYLALQPQIGLYIVKVDDNDFLLSVSNRQIQQMTPLHPKEFNEILEDHAVRRACQS